MLSNSEQRVLELAAQVIKLNYLMYIPPSYPHRSGLLYTKENGRTAMWNPLIDDGDLFRLAIAVPSVDLREVMLSTPHSIQESLETRCACIREAFVLKLAESVSGAGTNRQVDFANLNPAAEEGEQ